MHRPQEESEGEAARRHGNVDQVKKKRHEGATGGRTSRTQRSATVRGPLGALQQEQRALAARITTGAASGPRALLCLRMLVAATRRSRVLLLLALRNSYSLASEEACSVAKGPLPYTLLSKSQQSPDSFLLRYALPPGRRWLGEDLTLPTCIKVLYPNGTDEKTAEPKPLEKSYSPVSHPSAEHHVDLVVKAYEPRAGGGVGSYLCDMQVGETMLASVKSKRIMHGDAAVLGRWRNIGLVAGGTGVAPLLQIARIVLESPAAADRSTQVHLLSINRREEGILARKEIEQLESAHAERFKVAYSLTGEAPQGWVGHVGRGDAAMVRATLPPPTNDGKTMVLVCGTDGFVSTWGGPVGRASRQADGSKGAKIQGPLVGLLAEACAAAHRPPRPGGDALHARGRGTRTIRSNPVAAGGTTPPRCSNINALPL